MSGWRKCSRAIVAGVAAGSVLSACGSGARQDASESSGDFPVSVTSASFPASQQLAQHTHLVITVRNDGNKTIPDVAVTITDPHYGTSVQAFNQYLDMPGVASHSRPVWIVDDAPGAHGYSYQTGGPGGAVTAYSNTWALGALKPGGTATFDWAVTAVAAGTHVIRYQVAAGLNGKAKAVPAGGTPLTGTFTVTIHNKPAQSYVDNNGQIVTQ